MRLPRRAAAESRRIPDVGNPWLDAGHRALLHAALPHRPRLLGEVVPGRLGHRVLPRPVPQLVLLDAGHEHGAATRARPFKTLFGYATLLGEDGREMHKSWGNAIEFNEAAERMGVDVMRWMYASARPEDNILFGYHTADEARRELLVLWNVLRLLRHLRPSGRLVARTCRHRRAGSRRGPLACSIAGSCRVRRTWPRSPAPAWPTTTRAAPPAPSASSSTTSRTWWLRRSRRRLSRGDDADRPGRRLRHPAPGARQRGPHDRADAAVPGRGVPPGARGAGR